MVFGSVNAAASSEVGDHEADGTMRDRATPSSPSLGVTGARATAARDFDEHERAGLLTSESFFVPALPCTCTARWRALGAVVVRYSGATVRDFADALLRLRHPVPYSPAAVTAGTRSCFGLYPDFLERTARNVNHELTLSQSRRCD